MKFKVDVSLFEISDDFTVKRLCNASDFSVVGSLINCSSMTNEEQANPKYALDVVKEKLLDSLDAFERGANLGSRILEYNESRSKRPLHLSAIADGPRLRLLWAILQQIEEEARVLFVVLQCYFVGRFYPSFENLFIYFTWLKVAVHSFKPPNLN